MRYLILCALVLGLGGARITADDSVDEAVHAVNPGPCLIQLDDVVPSECITLEERAAVAEIIEHYRMKHPERAGNPAPGSLTFFPSAGRLYGDLFTTNFVDQDPTAGVLDWDCTNHSYDGHKGNDTGPRSFSEQLIGIPAYAALDGIVVYSHDGEYDMNTECNGTGNAVVIDHGGDLYGYYWHFKNGSVTVLEGDSVVAGQQIAQVASSGCSTGPHLHFELRDHGWFEGATFEPYTGTCNVGDSMWEDQREIDRDIYVEDHGVTATPTADWPQSPYRYPNDRQFRLDDTHQYYWQVLHNVPATGTYGFRFYRPDGVLAYESSGSWEYTSSYRTARWWWSWNITAMHNYAGTWSVDLVVNEEVLLNMQLEIVESIDEDFNRAPASIDIEMHPSSPDPDDVIECTVLGTLVHDDPDRDLVSYHYEWRVNDIVVRDLTAAAMRDVLQSDAAGSGDTVSVTVTPTDGELDADSTTGEVYIACDGDITGDGHVDVGDLLAVIAGWGDPYNVIDLLTVIDKWGPCP